MSIQEVDHMTKPVVPKRKFSSKYEELAFERRKDTLAFERKYGMPISLVVAEWAKVNRQLINQRNDLVREQNNIVGIQHTIKYYEELLRVLSDHMDQTMVSKEHLF